MTLCTLELWTPVRAQGHQALGIAWHNLCSVPCTPLRHGLLCAQTQRAAWHSEGAVPAGARSHAPSSWINSRHALRTLKRDREAPRAHAAFRHLPV